MAEWATNEGGAAFALAARPQRRTEGDALAAAMGLGDRSVRGGFALWTTLALCGHALVLAWSLGLVAMREMRGIVREMRAAQSEAFKMSFVDVDVDKPAPKPPPPPPEPEPAPALPAPRAEPVARPAAPPPKDDPYDPPPAPAQATKVLTSDDEPVDLTGQGFVSGDGTGPGYGQVSAAGTSTVPTMSPKATLGGVPGGTGTGPAVAPPPPPPGEDKSRAAGIVGSSAWSCPFPPEADTDQVDSARVTVIVTVRPDGSALSVKVVSDPGHGFGRAAKMCALTRRYTAGLDRSGQPVVTTTPPINVNFSR